MDRYYIQRKISLTDRDKALVYNVQMACVPIHLIRLNCRDNSAKTVHSNSLLFHLAHGCYQPFSDGEFRSFTVRPSIETLAVQLYSYIIVDTPCWLSTVIFQLSKRAYIVSYVLALFDCQREVTSLQSGLRMACSKHHLAANFFVWSFVIEFSRFTNDGALRGVVFEDSRIRVLLHLIISRQLSCYTNMAIYLAIFIYIFEIHIYVYLYINIK